MQDVDPVYIYWHPGACQVSPLSQKVPCVQRCQRSFEVIQSIASQATGRQAALVKVLQKRKKIDGQTNINLRKSNFNTLLPFLMIVFHCLALEDMSRRTAFHYFLFFFFKCYYFHLQRSQIKIIKGHPPSANFRQGGKKHNSPREGFLKSIKKVNRRFPLGGGFQKIRERFTFLWQCVFLSYMSFKYCNFVVLTMLDHSSPSLGWDSQNL